MYYEKMLVTVCRVLCLLGAIGVSYCIVASINGATEMIILLSQPDFDTDIKTYQCFSMMVTLLLFYHSAGMFGVVWPTYFALFGVRMTKEFHRRLLITSAISVALTMVVGFITLMIFVDGELKRNFTVTQLRRGFI